MARLCTPREAPRGRSWGVQSLAIRPQRRLTFSYPECTKLGGQFVSGGMMGSSAGGMMNGTWSDGMMGAGWKASDGTFGMLFTFTTA